MISMLVSNSVVFLTVNIRNFCQSEVWPPGIIFEVTGLVSYIFKLTDGQTVRQHQVSFLLSVFVQYIHA